MITSNRGYTKQITSEQEQAVARSQPKPYAFIAELKTYLGENFGGFASVPLYKIARQARADAFEDLEKKGFKHAYDQASCGFLNMLSDKFDHQQLFEYTSNYAQVVKGFYMAMGE